MRNLSKDQRDLMLSSPSVESLTESQVVYTSEFKKLAIKLREQGLTPDEIFIEGGLDFDFIDYDYMRKTIDRWCDLHDRIGDKMFTVETRGKRGHGKKFNPDDLDTFSKEDLKMLVYVLEGVVDELGKTKASSKKPSSKN
jgi:hypothetical protein